jgi:hypothetical protein
MTYDDLKKANATIKTTNVQGKEYAEVNQRIKAFRMLYPEGFIHTEILSNEGGVVVFRATVGDGDRVLATGTAYEKEGSSYINKTSYIENCETSAVGRALGMLGIGIDTAVASAEEVQNAIANQAEPAKKRLATPTQVEILAKAYTGESLKKLLEWFKVTKLEELTLADASGVIKRLEERKNDTKRE